MTEALFRRDAYVAACDAAVTRVTWSVDPPAGCNAQRPETVNEIPRFLVQPAYDRGADEPPQVAQCIDKAHRGTRHSARKSLRGDRPEGAVPSVGAGADNRQQNKRCYAGVLLRQNSSHHQHASPCQGETQMTAPLAMGATTSWLSANTLKKPVLNTRTVMVERPVSMGR